MMSCTAEARVEGRRHSHHPSHHQQGDGRVRVQVESVLERFTLPSTTFHRHPHCTCVTQRAPNTGTSTYARKSWCGHPWVIWHRKVPPSGLWLCGSASTWQWLLRARKERRGLLVVTGTTGRTSCGTPERLRPSIHHCRTCQPPRSTLVLYSGRGRVRNCRNKARSTFHDRGCGGNGGVIYLALWAYVGSRLGLHCVCIRVWASSSRTAYSGYCSLVLARHDTNVRQPAVTPALRRLADCSALFARSGLYRSLRFPVLTRTAFVSTRIHKNLEHPTVSPFSLFGHISRTFSTRVFIPFPALHADYGALCTDSGPEGTPVQIWQIILISKERKEYHVRMMGPSDGLMSRVASLGPLNTLVHISEPFVS